MDLYERTKEKLENWPLMSCSDEEKVQWFRETYSALIAKITLEGDRVDEIIVVDNLYDTASEALNEMPLPKDFPDQNVPREQVERDFTAYCKTIRIRTATFEQLAQFDENASPDQQFIRLLTVGMKMTGFIESWDRSLAFSEGLAQMGCPFNFSFDEKKLIFGLSHLMNCLALQAAKQSQESTNVEMFKM